MNSQSDFQAYLKAISETPVNIVFVLLDIAGVVTIIYWVVDDWKELAVVLAFLLVTHAGHYLIFRKQRTHIAKLGSRIAELESRLPRLDLMFLNEGELTRRQVIEVSSKPQELDFDELVRCEKEQLEMAFEDSEEGSIPGDLGRLPAIISQAMLTRRKSAEKYERECNTYLNQYRHYLYSLYSYEVQSARFRRIRFRIENSGKVPAEDVVVLIHFPDGFYFPPLEERVHMEYCEERPTPPVRPDPFTRPLEDLARVAPYIADSLAIPPVDISGTAANVSGPFIKSTDSTEVSYEIRKLMHGFGEDLDAVEFLVTDEAVGNSWELEYSIHATELSDPIEGSLLLAIRSSENDPDETEWITTAEAAKLTGYRVEYVRRLIREGKITAEKRGRNWLVDKGSVEVYVDR